MTSRGECQKWIEELAEAPVTDECVWWPFSKTKGGYAKAWNPRISRMDLVHRIVWERIHGGAFPSPVTRHSCGNGQKGCVNPRHICPGTQKENAADKRAHGTHREGASHSQALLSEEQVRHICESKAAGVSTESLMAELGVSKGVICDVWSGRTYATVDAVRSTQQIKVCRRCGGHVTSLDPRAVYCSRSCKSKDGGERYRARMRSSAVQSNIGF